MSEKQQRRLNIREELYLYIDGVQTRIDPDHPRASSPDLRITFSPGFRKPPVKPDEISPSPPLQ